MNDLARFFWELALLRRMPGDLPRSRWLLQLLLLLNLLLSALLGLSVFGTPLRALLAGAIDLGMSAGLLFTALHIRGRAERWMQAYTALLGVSALLAAIGLAYRGLLTFAGVPGLAAIPDLALFLWSVLVIGHILRHALDISLGFAILIVFAYTMVLFALVAQWAVPEIAAGNV